MNIKDVELTPEMEERLRSFLPINSQTTFKYTPLAFRELQKELWPVFTLRPISGPDALNASDVMAGEVSINRSAGTEKINVRRGAFVLTVCRQGIKGWENLYDGSGQEVKYDGSLTSLTEQMLGELCNAITEHAVMSEEELQGLR